MARYGSSLRVEEKSLLTELNSFANWIKTNQRKPMTIHLKNNQFNIFRRVCGRLKEHPIADVFVHKVDPNLQTFDGIPVKKIGPTPNNACTT